MRFVSLLLVAACTVETAATSDQAPPPPLPLTVVTSPFVRGNTAEVVVEGATPGDTMFLAWSPAEPGDTVCPPSWGGACAGLAEPISVIRTAAVDAQGVATFSLDLPANLVLDEAWMQAAVPGNPPFVSPAFVVDIEAADPFDRGWDGTGVRPPGPHDIERDLVSAWSLGTPTRPAVVHTTYGPTCNPTATGWASVFAPPAYPPGYYYYLYYDLDPVTDIATHQTCSPFSDCVDSVVDQQVPEFEVIDHTMAFTFDTESYNAFGCIVSQQITWEVVDHGQTGELNLHVDLGLGGACPSTANDGCTFTHTIDLEWVRAQARP